MTRTETNGRLILDVGSKVLRKQFPHLATLERLLCRPRDAIKFCAAVRTEMGVSNLADELILWPLLNWRKKGYLKSSEA